MTAEARSDVQWLCPSCDAEPPAGHRDPICASCGAKLIEVRTKAADLSGLIIDGRFEIRDLLGEGGMGSVYRAWQRSIGREVAIKLIDDRHSRDPMAVRRFLREARLASQLSQPNTVSVFDFGQSSDGRLFIAMELIRGKTLAEVLDADGPFPAARAAWIGVQLCDALDAAHRLKIVHRDLKPANVVLLDDPPGRDLIKVLDFGLAKSLTESETKATDTGLVVGTPRYMAPEVVMGEPPTAQSDLYAVGVILGELATGKVLWDATSFPALAGQKMHPSKVIDDIPPGLRAVVARLIDAEPSRRPADASDVRGLLRPLVTSSETPVPFTGPRAIIGGPAPTTSGKRAPAVTAATVPLLEIQIATPPPAAKPGAIAAVPSQALTIETPTPRPRSAAVVTPPPSIDSLSIERPRGRRGVAFAALVAAVVAAIAGAILVAGRGKGGGGRTYQPAGAVDAAVTAPPAADAATPTSTLDAAPVRTVTLTVRSKPPGAEVIVGGLPRGLAPAVVELPWSTEPVVVEVRRDGRSTQQRVVPDRDRTVTLAARRSTTGTGGGSDLPF